MESPTAPRDPRVDWALPAPGQLPTVARLDELTVRILAPNPSPMTLDGTNTYLLGPAGAGEVVVVDPGPTDAEHLARVEEEAAAWDAAIRAVLVTHHHVDHAEAASSWARRFGCAVVAASGEVAGPDGMVIVDGDRVGVGGLEIEVVATPGHTADHLAFRLPTGALLTGDHVLGRGTSVVASPDGDLVAYLDSLRRVLRLGPDALYPGHGPELTEDPAGVLTYYHDHRDYRRAQIEALLREESATPRELVEHIYADVDRRLWDAAEASTRATLDAMAAEGAVRSTTEERVELVDG